MFYPPLKRRNSYSKNRKNKYHSDYRKYLTEITEDCLSRCVYCDALTSEHGGEGFHLDHFRPAFHFPGLTKDPNNLVLACAKCNIFKSNNWHTNSCFHVCSSNDGEIGFYDPFYDQLSNYFSVDPSGYLVSRDSVSAYMLELLHLNRESRVQLRRKRILISKIKILSSTIERQLEELVEYLQGDNFDKKSAVAHASRIKVAQAILSKALSIIYP